MGKDSITFFLIMLVFLTLKNKKLPFLANLTFSTNKGNNQLVHNQIKVSIANKFLKQKIINQANHHYRA